MLLCYEATYFNADIHSGQIRNTIEDFEVHLKTNSADFSSTMLNTGTNLDMRPFRREPSIFIKVASLKILTGANYNGESIFLKKDFSKNYQYKYAL